MFHKVVVPLEGSELAQDVLPHVAEVVKGRGSQVYLLLAASLAKGISPPVVDALPPVAALQEERQRTERERMAYLQTVARRLESEADDVHISVCSGRAADEILAFVDEVGADLIAMSKSGRPGISRWVFGSVADRVLRDAPCPLLLVPTDPRRKTSSDASNETRPVETPGRRRIAYRHIVVPLDGSELAEQVLPCVEALIRPHQTRVFLIRVLTPGLGDRAMALLTSFPPGLQLATSVLHRAEVQVRGYLRSVAAALRERGAVVQIAVRQGSPAEEILAYAAEVEADVVGMTTHGLSGVSRWVYGSVAGKVLQEAQSPVLLVRPTFEQGGNGA